MYIAYSESVLSFLLTEDPGIAHEHERILPNPKHSVTYSTAFFSVI